MAKQLRLDVAQLTDVGRKREHNEDNMAYVIPKDLQVMARKGALFIVADGMGGHAAGEVASEIAVDTVSNAYYQDDSDDVTVSLVHAIKRANALIHQRAAENMLRSGMGTTCVAAVLRGNMAYIANVGDSRAYLVRAGHVKQISQDHSWVAEQVRAGLLTEDQARTHAQRNVITRSLGTQADVEIDIFSEPLDENDVLVLCSDGLSGLVSDEEIRRIVAQTAPQESVYHLVERANENGGPDNITAIVVRVQEVGWEPPGVRKPVPVGSRESGDDATMVQPMGASAASVMVGDGRNPSAPLRYPTGPLLSPENLPTAPQPAVRKSGSRHRLFYPTLALLIVALIALVTYAGYTWLRSTGNGDATQLLQSAQHLIDKANGEVASNPVAALQDLSSAQADLHNVQHSSSATDAEKANATQLLQGNLTTSTRNAIAKYNQVSGITTVCDSTPFNALNQGTVNTQARSLTAVQGKNGSVFYAVGADNNLYQIKNNSLLPLNGLVPAGSIINMSGDGNQLFILSQENGDANGPKYTLNVLPAEQTKIANSVTVEANTKSQRLPKLITAQGNDVYILLTSLDSQGTTVWLQDYTVTDGKLNTQPTTSNQFSVPQAVTSLAAFPDHRLFLMLADGSVQSLTFDPKNTVATNVLLPHAIPLPLSVSEKDFSGTGTPVPTSTPVPQSGTASLAIPVNPASTLVVGQVGNVPHLYVMDVAAHRILDLQVASGTATPTATTAITPTTGSGGGAVGGTNVMMQLVGQFVSTKYFAQLKSMTTEPQTTRWDILSQISPTVSDMVIVDPMAQNTCVHQ